MNENEIKVGDKVTVELSDTEPFVATVADIQDYRGEALYALVTPRGGSPLYVSRHRITSAEPGWADAAFAALCTLGTDETERLTTQREALTMENIKVGEVLWATVGSRYGPKRSEKVTAAWVAPNGSHVRDTQGRLFNITELSRAGGQMTGEAPGSGNNQAS